MKRLYILLILVFLAGCSVEPEITPLGAVYQKEFIVGGERVIVGGENLGATISNFTPEIKLEKWGDETWIKVWTDETGDSFATEKDGKVVWHNTDKSKEYNFYPTTLEDGTGAFEFEVILKEKPKTNVITLGIETKGLKFYYQGEITEQRKIPESDEAYLDEILDIISEEEPQTVLDFGGGTGELAKQLIDNGVETTVLDISQEAYDNRVVDDFILGDVFDELPKMADDSYDLIIDVGVLKYIDQERADELVSEIKRVSKKSIHFLGSGFWNPSDVEWLIAESDYNFWSDKFIQGTDEADLYKLLKDTRPKRPENVVGSYAVYHESKSGDYTALGGKNYKVGKAFHIYRPQMIDSNGWKVWGELNIDIKNGKQYITMPEDFWNKAVYPIKHASGEVFGYGEDGDSTTIINNVIIGSVFTGVAGTGVSISAQLDVVDNTKWMFALYKNSDSYLETNGVTVEADPLVQGHKVWRTLAFASAPTLTAIDYIIVAWAPADTNPYGDHAIWYDSGDTDQGHTDSETYDSSFPDPATFVHNNNVYSIYVTYTPTAPAGVNMTDGDVMLKSNTSHFKSGVTHIKQ